MSKWVKFDKNDLSTWPPYYGNVLVIDNFNDIQTFRHLLIDFCGKDHDLNNHVMMSYHGCEREPIITHWRTMIELPEDL